MSIRNPLLVINNKKYQTVGDVHLGRKYVNGVPIHMRGTMERMQREKFKILLDRSDVSYIVLVGDLFDSFVVDPSDVDFAANTTLAAARNNPNVGFVVLGGNHDIAKDVTRISSFENFKAILREANLPNLHLVDNVSIIDNVGYISWSAVHSAKELAGQLMDKTTKTLDAVFGHWDVHLPSHANHYNMIPVEILAAITSKIITGHVHKPEVIERDGVEITITGSILPLSHGEEVESDDLFYTVTRKEYDEDPEKYSNKFVRFVLGEDEELPEGDFLQIKAYVKPEKKSISDDEVTEFDVSKILKQFLLDNDVADARAAEVVEKFDAKQDKD